MNDPKSLYDIYKEIMQGTIGITCFRVRDTDTLIDYLICRHHMWKWDWQNMPDQMWAKSLDEGFSNIYYPMDCHADSYALLSSRAEIQYFRTLGPDLTEAELQLSYKGWH